jgi:ABC-type antimicrobial peptide transport system ATPase subunit
MADEFMVLAGGKVVEYGPTDSVMAEPRHHVTQIMLASDATLAGKRTLLQ